MKKILVIDDKVALCFFVKTNLELRGDYKVIDAANGELEEKIEDALDK